MHPHTHHYIEDIEPALPSRIHACGPGDVHLGSENRVRALTELLSELAPKVLIFNGDLFDSARLDRLSPDDLAFLDLIDTKRLAGTEIVHILGNHDRGLGTICGRWPFRHGGWVMREEYLLEYRGVRYFFTHGDQYVKWLKLWRATSRYGGTLNYYLKKLETEKKGITMQVKRAGQLWLRMADDVERGIAARAREEKAHVAIAGHSHLATERMHEDVRYLNVGSFVDRHCGFFTIDEEGTARLHIVTTRKRPLLVFA